MTHMMLNLIILSNSADANKPTCTKVGYSLVSPFTNKNLPPISPQPESFCDAAEQGNSQAFRGDRLKAKFWHQ